MNAGEESMAVANSGDEGDLRLVHAGARRRASVHSGGAATEQVQWYEENGGTAPGFGLRRGDERR